VYGASNSQAVIGAPAPVEMITLLGTPLAAQRTQPRPARNGNRC
jgi:hypothetical protein